MIVIHRIFRPMKWIRTAAICALPVLIFFPACKKDKQKSSQKSIDSFSIKIAKNPQLPKDIYGIIREDSILLPVSATWNLVNLTPTISWTGESISPSADQPGNFAQTKVYTVTAEDGSQKTYRTHLRFLSASKEITSFTFLKSLNPSLPADITGLIQGDTILLVLPPGINVKNLKPSIEHTGVTVMPNSGQVYDYSLPANYNVVAEDGTVRSYRVFAGANSDIYISGTDNKLYAINGLSGAIKWVYNSGSQATPTYSNGTVFVQAGDNGILALNAADGSFKWKTAPLSTSTSYNLSLPAVRNGRIYFGGKGHFPIPGAPTKYRPFVMALDQQTGNLIWVDTLRIANFNWQDMPNTNVTASDNYVCLFEVMHGIHVFHASDGAWAWSRPYEILGRTNPLMRDNRIIYSTESGLHSVNEANGDVFWSRLPLSNWRSVISDDAGIYATVKRGDTSFLIAYDFDGLKKWGSYIINNTFDTPTQDGELLFVSSTVTNHRLYAYRKSDGQMLWDLPQHEAHPVGANGSLYTVNSNGNLLCLESATGTVKWTTTANIFVAPTVCVVGTDGKTFHIADSGDQQ